MKRLIKHALRASLSLACTSLVLLMPNTSIGQDTDKLYIVLSVDSTQYGLVNADGDTVLPISQYVFGDMEAGMEFIEPVIELWNKEAVLAQHPNYDLMPAVVNSAIYNRKMTFLYYPFWFDNGADYFVENRRRYVDIQTGKMGFVNSNHEIVVPAQWDFVSTYNNGYAQVFNNYEKDYVDDSKEHYTIRPKGENAYTAMIDRRGQVVPTSSKAQHDSDYYVMDLNGYLPDAFSNTAQYAGLIEGNNHLDILKDIYILNNYRGTKDTFSAHYVVIDTPSTKENAYYLQLIVDQRNVDIFNIKYKVDQQRFYCSYDSELWKPIEASIYEYLVEIKSYRSNYPHNLPFNLEEMLDKYAHFLNEK